MTTARARRASPRSSSAAAGRRRPSWATTASPASLCRRVNDEVVHGIPGSRVLVEGDLVSIDCGAIVDGLARRRGRLGRRRRPAGAARGRPGARSTRTEESLWAGIAALRVGSPLCDVGAAVEDAVVAAGQARGADYGIVEDYVGHGIGTEMHQDPQVPNYRVARPRAHGAVRAGRGDRADGHPRQRRDPRPGRRLDRRDAGRRLARAHWEHSVAVHEDGLWVLTALDGGQSGSRRSARRTRRCPDALAGRSGRRCGVAGSGRSGEACESAGAWPLTDFLRRGVMS